MELIQLEATWKSFDKKIAENARINKEILKKLLISQPKRRLNWIKTKAVFNAFSPLIFITLILVLDVRFQIETKFYFGLALFLPIYLITYFWDMKFFILVYKTDFTMPVLSIKKMIAQLEKYKIKTTRIKYLLMPIAFLGFILMIATKINLQLDFISFVPLFLIVLVWILSFIFTIKYSIVEPFKRLNKEIDEIIRLEKDE